MKLSQETIKVLRNFASINPSILVRPGSLLSTISYPGKTVMARATVPDAFETEFAIYDLSRFLNALSLLGDPDLTFTAKSVSAVSEGRALRYALAEPSMIVAAPTKDIAMPPTYVEVDLPEAVLKAATSALRVLGLNEIAVTGDGESVFLQAVDAKGTTNDDYSVKVDADPPGKKFRALFKIDNLKLLPSAYTVKLTEKGISHWVGEAAEYFISVEKDSKFE
jgi:hypothetical protein